jgi:hypothetical protein
MGFVPGDSRLHSFIAITIRNALTPPPPQLVSFRVRVWRASTFHEGV